MSDTAMDEPAAASSAETPSASGEATSEPAAAAMPAEAASVESPAEPSSEQSAEPQAEAPAEAAARAVPVPSAPLGDDQAAALPAKYSEVDHATALLDDRKPDPYDAESTTEKLKYPKSVFFIVGNEFCERFSYYGMRTILVLYLTSILNYHQDDATIIYHIFTMFAYFFPVIGSMIADSWLGKFRTIFFLSIVYAIGNIIISLASASGSINIPGRELTILGLLLIAFGTGGIKPCVSAFGGDQFIIPKQEKQMAQFFSLFYFAINSGSLVSTFLTPVLREDVQCFNQDSCYPLAFGVPAVLMVVSIIVFVLGKSMYIIKKPQGNIVVQVFKCMCHAVGQKTRSKGQKRDHWLDYADDKYDRKQIEDIKSALRVLFLYLPLPFFWALFDQQGSRWTFQATRMTGYLGGWSLKPDQMQVVNPLLILLFIPMFETCIYPILRKCNLLTRPLQRLGAGGVLAGVAFAISAVVELQLESTYAVLPKAGEGQIRIYNALHCDVVMKTIDSDINDILISDGQFYKEEHWSVSNEKTYEFTYSDCSGQPFSVDLKVFERNGASYLISSRGFRYLGRSMDIDKKDERARLSLIFDDVPGSEVTVGDVSYEVNNTGGVSNIEDFTPKDGYDINVNGKPIGTLNLKVGGVYTAMIRKKKSSNDYEHLLFTITPPNDVHMLWLIPQYVVMTMGEVMFSITGLEFSYSQAPLSMKSVMQAGWLLTVAFGNLIVIIIAEAKFFDRQLWEFVLFAGLMIVDMMIFALMAMGYKYIEVPHEGQNDIPLESNKEKSGIDNKNFKTDDEQ